MGPRNQILVDSQICTSCTLPHGAGFLRSIALLRYFVLLEPLEAAERFALLLRAINRKGGHSAWSGHSACRGYSEHGCPRGLIETFALSELKGTEESPQPSRLLAVTGF